MYAVSYDKGCFLGQEPLARVHARGQVNRVMVRLRGETVDPAATADFPRALTSDEREKAGEWTTMAAREGGTWGLALVHRSLARPGAQVRDEAGHVLEVVSEPLGDDPGLRR